VWKAGKIVDVFGFSGGDNHQEWSKGRWQHWCIVDLTRSGSKGKPFWNAEMASGNSWRMRNGRPKDRGRIVSASDVRLYNIISFAGGTSGIFSPRWRPLLDGPFAGSFAFYEMDGAPTERSRMAGRMAQWANAPEQEELWRAKPVKGDLGIVVVPESQIHCYLSEQSTRFYSHSITGAYQAFLFSNIQADFVYIDEVKDGEYDLLYLPYPIMLPEKAVEALKTWVENGGYLVSEGCPAYFGDRGRAGTLQPNYGLRQVFGAIQDDVEFTPDLLDELKVKLAAGYSIYGGVYLQSYEPTGGYTDRAYFI
jgi:beta-galactosidase